MIELTFKRREKELFTDLTQMFNIAKEAYDYNVTELKYEIKEEHRVELEKIIPEAMELKLIWGVKVEFSDETKLIGKNLLIKLTE